MFRNSTTTLSRQLLRTSTPALRFASSRPFSSSLARFDQPPSFPGLDPKLAAALENSPIGRMLTTDPDVKDLFGRFESVMSRKGYTAMNPPSKTQLGMLLMDSEFRSALTDSQALLAKHKIAPEEMQKLASTLMAATKGDATSPDGPSPTGGPSPTEPHPTTPTTGWSQPSAPPGAVAPQLIEHTDPLRSPEIDSSADTPVSDAPSNSASQRGREEKEVEPSSPREEGKGAGFFSKLFGQK